MALRYSMLIAITLSITITTYHVCHVNAYFWPQIAGGGRHIPAKVGRLDVSTNGRVERIRMRNAVGQIGRVRQAQLSRSVARSASERTSCAAGVERSVTEVRTKELLYLFFNGIVSSAPIHNYFWYISSIRTYI